MTNNAQRKSILLRSCGAGALALGSMFASSQASAQAFNAAPTVVQGTVTIDGTIPGQDTITVDGLNAVIDWIPDENVAGDALTFLPSGTTAIFQGELGATNFAVINRVLPATNNNVTVMDGTIISQLRDSSGVPTGPGGFVAF